MSAEPATIEQHATATDASAAQPTLVFFFSPTSGACRRADGFLAQVLQHRANHSTFRLIRIDANRRPDLLKRLRVTELPTLLVVAEGRVRGRLAKPTGCRQITNLLQPWLK